MSPTSLLRTSTPGRVCLFGEHQDYLHLPVIPCAINLRITIEGSARDDLAIRIDLEDLGVRETFLLTESLSYTEERDYLKSAVNVLLRNGFTFPHGCNCAIRGKIPINAGTSSSSALVVGWINFLARMSAQGTALSPHRIAELAHAAEVLEFNEPGGMMDHYATAIGGVMCIEFEPTRVVRPLSPDLGTFVLGNSLEPKDTKSILSRVKQGILGIVDQLKKREQGFALRQESTESIRRFNGRVTTDEMKLLAATIRNHEITREARDLLEQTRLNHQRIGILLTDHQQVLRDELRISTPKIDRMLQAALRAGAYGGKINGSGGGGCMFAYAPEDPERVAAAIEEEGGIATIIRPDAGTRVETARGEI